MENREHHIAIISDKEPRTEVLCKIIKDNFEEIEQVPIIHTDNLDSIKTIKKPLVVLIDLMGTDRSSKEIILPLKQQDSTIKLIALHMYQSPKLINPLYNMGINGYIFYEPNRRELVEAIEIVTKGETYKPGYLQSA
jgi:DNA-binding NarL/FixJ family response regulator